MKYKILIHAPILSSPGGKQNYFSALQDKFQHQIEFFFYGSKGRKESLLTVPIRLLKDYWKFYRKLKKNNYDLVHLNPSLNIKSFFRDSIFAFICGFTGVRMIVFWRGWRWDFEKKYVGKIVPFFRLTFGKATAMICLASAFSDKLRAYGYEGPIYLETTVVEDSIIDFKPPIEAVRQDAQEIAILFLSRVEKLKGIYETIDSFQNLQGKFTNIKLNIAGTGSELESVKAYVARNKIPNIYFLGWVNGNQKAATLYDSNIFVLPSYSEGMPNCVLEAMAMGKTVITTNVGGIKDFFEDGKMGFKVNINDTPDLEQKIEKLLLNRPLMNQISSFNKIYARERFTVDMVCKRLENIYSATILGTDYKHDYPDHS